MGDCICASVGSVIFGILCLLLSVGMIIQCLFIDDPFNFYTDEYLSKMVIVSRYMSLWCCAQGAIGVTTSLISIIFAFRCSGCGLPTAVVFDVLCVLSSLGMAIINSYEWVSSSPEDYEFYVPMTILGVPFLSAFLFLILTLCSSCTMKGQKESKMFFNI